ncbi:MAG TPA: DUF1918 domain-containing protein [Candidatus Limnocylindrales bacterium]|nr:DUF1918 domain-containing protein [Candidatus Limnocylindrales bacterium]
MQARVGDHIAIESERVGTPARHGEVLEVHESPYGVEYRVRWDDGRVTEVRPKAGSAQLTPKPPKTRP